MLGHVSLENSLKRHVHNRQHRDSSTTRRMRAGFTQNDKFELVQHLRPIESWPRYSRRTHDAKAVSGTLRASLIPPRDSAYEGYPDISFCVVCKQLSLHEEISAK